MSCSSQSSEERYRGEERLLEFQGRVLKGAGAIFLQQDQECQPCMADLKDVLLQHITPGYTAESGREYTEFIQEAVSAMKHEQSTTYRFPLGQSSASDPVQMAEILAHNAKILRTCGCSEGNWRFWCHNGPLQSLWEKWQDLLDLNDLREWEPLTIDTGNGRSIEILANRCGYSISLTSSMGDDDETSVRNDRQIFSHAVFAKIADKGRVNLYADADRAVALSIACGEARSPLGSDLEAENEMSRNIIKMLHRFHK